MFKGLGDITNILKNAQEMQSKLEELKQQLGEIAVQAGSGGGMVKIQGRGDGRFEAIVIEETLLQGGDREMLQDLLVAACNDFQIRLDETRKHKMAELAQGLNLPAGMIPGL